MTETNPYLPPQQTPDQAWQVPDARSFNTLLRVGTTTVLTIASGAASHYARVVRPTSPHMDALGLFVVLLLFSLWLIYWCSKYDSNQAYRWFHIGLAGCWWGAIVGWETTEYFNPHFAHLVDDIVFLLGAWHAGIAAFGSAAIWLAQKIRANKRPEGT